MRILVVDDHQLFIDGIRHILNKLDDQVNIIESNSAGVAIQHIGSDLDIDMILLDLHMPGMDGMSIIKRINSSENNIPVVIISAEENIYEIKSIIDAGAMGFIPKSSTSQELQTALMSVMSGELYFPEQIRKQINKLTPRRSAKQSSDENGPKGTGLTKRQQEILELLARGYSNKQLATSLHLSENTVKVHVSGIYRAMGVSSRTQCVKIARQNGLIN